MSRLVLGFALLLGGCTTHGGDVATTQAIPVAPEAPAQAMVFTDANGHVACPVMGDVIPKPDDTTLKQTYNGVTYYFCCQACADEFAKDPAKYADGKYLAEMKADGMDMDDGADRDDGHHPCPDHCDHHPGSSE